MGKRAGWYFTAVMTVWSSQSIKQSFMYIVKTTVGHHQDKISGSGLTHKKFNNGIRIGKKMGILTAFL
jgi:hypothetical protein